MSKWKVYQIIKFVKSIKYLEFNFKFSALWTFNLSFNPQALLEYLPALSARCSPEDGE